MMNKMLKTFAQRMGWFSLFSFLLVLTLASCHSSKKAMKDKSDKTKPTTTITTPTTSTKKPDRQEPDLNKMKVAVGTNFTSKVRVTITQEGKDVTTNGNHWALPRLDVSNSHPIRCSSSTVSTSAMSIPTTRISLP